jgi:hypothetical protein
VAVDVDVKADEFSLVTFGTWGRLCCRGCRKTVTFSSPTGDRVAFYGESHRCGPAGSAWDSDTPSRVTESDRAELISRLCGAIRALEGLPVDSLCNPELRSVAQPLMGLLSDGLVMVPPPKAASSVAGTDDEGEGNLAGLAALVAATEELG